MSYDRTTSIKERLFAAGVRAILGFGAFALSFYLTVLVVAEWLTPHSELLALGVLALAALGGGALGGSLSGKPGPGAISGVVLAGIASTVLAHEATIMTLAPFFSEPLATGFFAALHWIWVTGVTLCAAAGFFSGAVNAGQ